MKNLDYYVWAIVFSIILTIICLSLAPLVPIDEPLVYVGSTGVTYNLTIPVGVSFSAFISLMIFIISILVISNSKTIFTT